MFLLFYIHFAATLFLTGAVWFVQVVHYPLLRRVGHDGFVGYQKRNSLVTKLVIGPPMLVELLTGVAFLRFRPFFMGTEQVWLGLALIFVIWLSTILVQMPLHRRLARGFDSPVHRWLVGTNWVRTLAWTGRTVLLVWVAA